MKGKQSPQTPLDFQFQPRGVNVAGKVLVLFATSASEMMNKIRPGSSFLKEIIAYV